MADITYNLYCLYKVRSCFKLGHHGVIDTFLWANGTSMAMWDLAKLVKRALSGSL